MNTKALCAFCLLALIAVGAETEITLESGPHTLQMLLGDHLPVPHDPPLISDPITIHVE